MLSNWVVSRIQLLALYLDVLLQKEKDLREELSHEGESYVEEMEALKQEILRVNEELGLVA